MQAEQPAATPARGCPVAHDDGGAPRLNEVTAPVVDSLGRRHT
jgi:hypothetical protein